MAEIITPGDILEMVNRMYLRDKINDEKFKKYINIINRWERLQWK